MKANIYPLKIHTILKTLTAKGAKVSSIESRPSYGDASIANLAEFLTALPPYILHHY
jgi:hypothetical protein